jgi:hypothetical protein
MWKDVSSIIMVDSLHVLRCRSPDVFVAYKLKRGQWVPTKLQITSFAVERLDGSGK